MEEDFRYQFENAILGFEMRHPQIAASLRTLSLSKAQLAEMQTIYERNSFEEIAINLRVLKYARTRGEEKDAFAPMRADARQKLLNYSIQLFDKNKKAYDDFKEVVIEFFDGHHDEQQQTIRMFSALEEMKKDLVFGRPEPR